MNDSVPHEEGTGSWLQSHWEYHDQTERNTQHWNGESGGSVHTQPQAHQAALDYSYWDRGSTYQAEGSLDTDPVHPPTQRHTPVTAILEDDHGKRHGDGTIPVPYVTGALAGRYNGARDYHGQALQHRPYFEEQYNFQADPSQVMSAQSKAPLISTEALGTFFGTGDRRFTSTCSRGPSQSASTVDASSPGHSGPNSAADSSLACPNGCGTVLTGTHAAGNLARHLRTTSCGVGRVKQLYYCPAQGCGRVYQRSDGVKVHMRKQHGAPPAQPRYGPIVVDDDEEEDEDGVGEDEDAE